MDFLKLLRSFEELLFEALSWIIYFPLTMWRVIRRPLAMVDYSNHEQTDDQSERYTDTLSPVLLLLFTIVLMHGVEIATRAPTIVADTAAAKAITASDESLVVARAFLFGLLPLFAAWRYVAARGLPLERKHLRGPFYGQCYLAAPLVLVVSLSITAATLGPPPVVPVARLVGIASLVWYLSVQTLLYKSSLGWSTPRAFGLALRAFLEAFATFVAVALIITYGP